MTSEKFILNAAGKLATAAGKEIEVIIPKESLTEKLAAGGVVNAVKIFNWLPGRMVKQLAKDPDKFRLEWGKVALATAVWLQLVTSVLNPILMYFQYRKDRNLKPQDRIMLIAQETAKQLVHLCLHVGVMVIGVNLAKGAIIKSVVNTVKKDAALASQVLSKNLDNTFSLNKSYIDSYITGVSNVAGCIAGAVMLPILGATLFKAIDKKMGLSNGGNKGLVEEAAEQTDGLNVTSHAPAFHPHPASYHPPLLHPIYLNGNQDQGKNQVPQLNSPGQPATTFKGNSHPYQKSPFTSYQPLSNAMNR